MWLVSLIMLSVSSNFIFIKEPFIELIWTDHMLIGLRWLVMLDARKVRMLLANLLGFIKALSDSNLLFANTKLLFIFTSSACNAVILFISFSMFFEITENVVKSSGDFNCINDSICNNDLFFLLKIALQSGKNKQLMLSLVSLCKVVNLTLICSAIGSTWLMSGCLLCCGFVSYDWICSDVTLKQKKLFIFSCAFWFINFIMRSDEVLLAISLDANALLTLSLNNLNTHVMSEYLTISWWIFFSCYPAHTLLLPLCSSL